VTAITESKDLSIITIAALFGNEMQKINEKESSEKKVKTIALKTS